MPRSLMARDKKVMPTRSVFFFSKVKSEILTAPRKICELEAQPVSSIIARIPTINVYYYVVALPESGMSPAAAVRAHQKVRPGLIFASLPIHQCESFSINQFCFDATENLHLEI